METWVVLGDFSEIVGWELVIILSRGRKILRDDLSSGEVYLRGARRGIDERWTEVGSCVVLRSDCGG
jgi:hypothetical protein